MEEITRLTARDAADVARICDRTFGAGYLAVNDVLDNACQFGLFVDGRLVSVCMAESQSCDVANANVLSPRFVRPVLFVHTIATADTFQHRGFASRLVRHMSETHADNDFYATAWTTNGIVHAEKTFADADFTKEFELRRFYADDGAPSGCPVCGPENVCGCSAWLFTRMAG